MPYAIHLRKSRADLEAEARGEGESLARHRARLLAFAERAGLPIVAEYSEIISGDRLSDRPEMQRLLADVAAGMYDGVLTVEVSRLTRGDLMDQGRIMNTFKYSGTKSSSMERMVFSTRDKAVAVVRQPGVGHLSISYREPRALPLSLRTIALPQTAQ